MRVVGNSIALLLGGSGASEQEASQSTKECYDAAWAEAEATRTENKVFHENFYKVAPRFLRPFLSIAPILPERLKAKVFYPCISDILNDYYMQKEWYESNFGSPFRMKARFVLRAIVETASSCGVALTDKSLRDEKIRRPILRPRSQYLDKGRRVTAYCSCPASSSYAKRVIDVVGAAAGLALLLPLMSVIAFLIRLTSPGPIIFRQLRQGQGGRPFWFLKFRTMTADAEHRLRDLEPLNEAAGGVLFKMRRDPRVTPLGRWLRRTSLDELPQLLNVLRGEMSLIGPRPLQMRDTALLEQMDPEAYSRRLTVRPGLTGAWQVGGRSEADSLGMLQLDLAYIKNWSLRRDLGILCRTVGAVLRGRGTY